MAQETRSQRWIPAWTNGREEIITKPADGQLTLSNRLNLEWSEMDVTVHIPDDLAERLGAGGTYLVERSKHGSAAGGILTGAGHRRYRPGQLSTSRWAYRYSPGPVWQRDPPLEAGGTRARGGFFVNHAKLHPNDLGHDGDGFLHDGGHGRRFTENIDHFDSPRNR